MSSANASPQFPPAQVDRPGMQLGARPVAGADAARDAAPVMRAEQARAPRAAAARKPPRHGLYAAGWGVLGVIAGAYVFTLVLRQDVGGLAANRSDSKDIVDAQVVAKTQSDVDQLKRTVGQIETDVARMKIESAQADDRERQLAQRVANVETKIDQFTTEVVPAQPEPKPAKGAKTPVAKLVPPTSKAAKIATSALPTPAKPQPSTQRELAAIRQSAPAAAASVGQEPQSGVLLARGPSVDALRLSWSLLNERHKGTLKSMEPRVVEVEPGSYQLVAGPVANPAEALKVCSTLRSRGVACQAADYKGSGL